MINSLGNFEMNFIWIS